MCRGSSLRFFFCLVLGVLAHGGAKSDETRDALLARARGVLAKIDGQVHVAGLRQPVEILRDSWGVAHIYAQNSHDLFFAQGYSMAQDRLFQVDLWRRIAVGETAELFGEQAIEADRFARLLRFRGDMDAEWNSYAPDAHEIAVAFTAGINAYIQSIQDQLPIEFSLAGYRPADWKPEDILGRMSGIIMSGNWEKEIARAQLIQKVGLDKARMLAPTDPDVPFAPDPTLDLSLIRAEIAGSYRAATRMLKFTPSSSESNNWVVSHTRSASGKPLLASDPHRPTSLPSLRYLVHLHAPGWNVIGSGEPGLPGVALGHNERIAWGFTIVGTDQADLFVERTHPGDPRQYRVRDHWEPMRIVHESIDVQGRQEPVELELRYTRHGPVIFQDESRQLAISLKWAGSEAGGAAYLASLAVARAQDRGEFLDALSRWKIPCLNFVYADVDNQIGWVAAAATPVRKNGYGLLPVPGDTDDYEWERYLRPDEWPASFNPPAGWLGTANHKIVPAGYRPTIAYDWSDPYRFLRIQERMSVAQQFSLADFQSLQHDSTSLAAKSLQAIVRNVRFPRDLETFVDLVLGWDADLNRTSAAGALYAIWIQEIVSEMYGLHAGVEEAPDRADLRRLPVVLKHLADPGPHWFGENPVARRDQLLAETLTRAVSRARTLLGAEIANWQWGRLHQVTFRHPLEQLGRSHADAFNLGPIPRPGDANTPLNTRHDKEFQQIHGATYRHIFDLADWDRGLATSAPGQSGQPGSPHYDDLLPLWSEGKYFPLAYSREKVEEVTRNRLVLLP